MCDAAASSAFCSGQPRNRRASGRRLLLQVMSGPFRRSLGHNCIGHYYIGHPYFRSFCQSLGSGGLAIGICIGAVTEELSGEDGVRRGLRKRQRERKQKGLEEKRSKREHDGDSAAEDEEQIPDRHAASPQDERHTQVAHAGTLADGRRTAIS